MVRQKLLKNIVYHQTLLSESLFMMCIGQDSAAPFSWMMGSTASLGTGGAATETQSKNLWGRTNLRT